MDIKIKSIEIDIGEDWQYFDGSIFYTLDSLAILAARIRDAYHEGWVYKDLREDRDIAGLIHVKFEKANGSLPSQPLT